MEDIDMSRPGAELFPDTAMPPQYNSYADENQGHAVDDPLDTGANNLDAAGQGMSEQQSNFRALRDEISKMKEEREYWKGQADAYSKQPQHTEPVHASKEDAYSALDWDDSTDVRKAFETLRNDNQKLREEVKDAVSAVQTKAKRGDWDSMVTQHVPQLTSQNPIFAEMIRNTSNPYEAAYLLAELNSKATQQAETSMTGQRALTNAQKPQSLASVGGRGQLSQADYYARMPDKEFMELAARNLANV
jgi:hypothetical protein